MMLPAFPRVAPPGYRPPSPAPTLPLSSSPRSLASPPLTSVLRRLYLSHFLSTWNSRTFEFAAVLFLATATTAFRGTLTYASVYALVRGVAAVAMAPYVGGLMDRADRLEGIRASIGGCSFTSTWLSLQPGTESIRCFRMWLKSCWTACLVLPLHSRDETAGRCSAACDGWWSASACNAVAAAEDSVGQYGSLRANWVSCACAEN